MEVSQSDSEQAPAAQTPWEAPELVKVDVATTTLSSANNGADGGIFS